MKEIAEQYKSATDQFLNLVTTLEEEDLDTLYCNFVWECITNPN